MESKTKDNRWIERLLSQQPRKSKSGLAKAMGLPPPRVTEIIQGVRHIKAKEMVDIAEYLGISLDEAASLSDGANRKKEHKPKVIRMTIRGRVQAGSWQEAVEDENLGDITLPAIDEHDVLFALKVEGKSMDKVFPPGTLLICTPISEYLHSLESGKYVIVHRHSPEGLWEATCKRYHVAEDGTLWLIPESSDPKFQAPLELTDSDQDKIKITAVVIGDYRQR